MGKNKKSFTDSLSVLADIVNLIEQSELFEENVEISIELTDDKYQEVISNFREIDRLNKKFTIDISGVKFNFSLKK
jgi:hypothetical protein